MGEMQTASKLVEMTQPLFLATSAHSATTKPANTYIDRIAPKDRDSVPYLTKDPRPDHRNEVFLGPTCL